MMTFLSMLFGPIFWFCFYFPNFFSHLWYFSKFQFLVFIYLTNISFLYLLHFILLFSSLLFSCLPLYSFHYFSFLFSSFISFLRLNGFTHGAMGVSVTSQSRTYVLLYNLQYKCRHYLFYSFPLLCLTHDTRGWS